MNTNIKALLFAPLFIVLPLLFSPNTLFGQTWERNYGGSREDVGTCIVKTWDGGFLAAGHHFDPNQSQNAEDLFLVRINALGDLQWTKSYGDADEVKIFDMVTAKDGSYLLCGSDNDPVADSSGFQFYRISPGGGLVWEAKYDTLTQNRRRASQIIEYAQSDLYFTGYQGIGASRFQNILGKLDAQGNLLWTKTLGGLDTQAGTALAEDPAGNLAVIGWIDPLGPPQDTSIIFYRLDTAGNLLDSSIVGIAGADVVPVDIMALANGNFLVAGRYESTGFGRYDVFLTELAPDGTALWDTTYGVFGNSEYVYDMDTLTNGNIVVSGYTAINPGGQVDAWLIETTQQGVFLSDTTFGGAAEERALGIVGTSNGGTVMAGHTLSLGNGSYPDVYLLRTGPNGVLNTLEVSGRILFDKDQNGSVSPQDSAMGGWMIKLESAGQSPVYQLSQPDGRFTFSVDTNVSYIVSVLPLNAAWGPVTPVIHVFNYTTALFPLDTLDFLVDTAQSCPQMTVDISAPLVQNGDTVDYAVSYCNYGTVPANPARIELTFDSAFTGFFSIPAPSSQTGNVLTYNLGTVGVGDCGFFRVRAFLGNPQYDHQTHCVEAHIFPDDICAPENPAWNGSELELTATCINDDSVRFSISNTGQAPMALPGGVIVVEDDIMRFNNTIQLSNGASQELDFNASGGTWYTKVYHISPYSNFAEMAIFVEGCGDTVMTQISTGYATDVGQNDEAPTISIDCQEDDTSSVFAPNYKSAAPGGVGPEHYITRFADLEYLIRFQNPGPGPSGTIVVRDTLSPFLDITTVQPGAASHPYAFAILPGNILEWRFNGINLPDSGTSFPGSMGFVKFRAAIADSTPLGTVILNRAGILMENQNQPMVTNETFHTLRAVTGFYLPDSISSSNGQDITLFQDGVILLPNLKVFPNPAHETVQFDLGQSYPEVELEIYNVQGVQLRKIRFSSKQAFVWWRNGLPTGLYLWRLTSQGNVLATGKLMLD